LQGKALIATVLVIMAMVFCGLSLMAPWYSVEMESKGVGFTSKGQIVYYLDHIEVEYFGTSYERSYDNEQYDNVSFIDTFRTTGIIVYIAIFGCIIGTIGALMIFFEKIPHNLGIFLVTLAMILCLLAPLFLMVALPGSFQKDFADSDDELTSRLGREFFGSETQESGLSTAEVKWGGSVGWVMTMIAAMMCFAALVLVYFSKPTPTDSDDYPDVADTWATSDPKTMYVKEDVNSYQAYKQEQEDGVPLLLQPVGPPPPPGSKTGRFQCPNCKKVNIISTLKRPLRIRCPKCNRVGIIE
jgi:hypothetical protein